MGFAADKPNQKRVVDIPCIWTREGLLYLAALIDSHSKPIIGWSVSNLMENDLGRTCRK
jgi:putative transposase